MNKNTFYGGIIAAMLLALFSVPFLLQSNYFGGRTSSSRALLTQDSTWSGTNTFDSGVIFGTSTPATTTNALYIDGGNLAFNGSAVGGGGSAAAVAATSSLTIIDVANLAASDVLAVSDGHGSSITFSFENLAGDGTVVNYNKGGSATGTIDYGGGADDKTVLNSIAYAIARSAVDINPVVTTLSIFNSNFFTYDATPYSYPGGVASTTSFVFENRIPGTAGNSATWTVSSTAMTSTAWGGGTD